MKSINPFRQLFVLFAFTSFCLTGTAQEMDPGQAEFDRTKIPIAQPAFKGKASLRIEDSRLDFPAEVKAPQGAPNILLIMPDDVGFGASTAFGGPVPTVALDRVAAAGLRYNAFHTTRLTLV